jgi:hypothetical protein
VICKIDKRRRSDGNEHIGSQSSASLAILPFSPNPGSKHKCGQQADQRVQKVVELKSLKKTHGFISIEIE